MDRTERCDAKECGAQAYVFVDIGGSSVAYCGHHGELYMPGLVKVASSVTDMRHMIGYA